MINGKICLAVAMVFLICIAPANAAKPSGDIEKILSGMVTEEGTMNTINGAIISAGGFQTTTNNAGEYDMLLPAGTYNVVCTADGYQDEIVIVTIRNKDVTKDFSLIQETPTTLTISTLTATPSSFTVGAVSTISLDATIDGNPTDHTWNQTSGPSVDITSISATQAEVDVSALDVTSETELVFELYVSDGTYSNTKQVSVFALPQGGNLITSDYVRIGGSSNAVTKIENNGIEWALYNTAGTLKATPIGMEKGAVYSVDVPGYIYDILTVDYDGSSYALIAAGSEGVIVVDITDLTNISVVSATRLNYYFDGITFAEGGGAILYDNIKSSSRAAVSALETDGVNLYIANFDYGIQKIALSNLLGGSGPVLEDDGTLQVDSEQLTLQYAGENPWGRPNSIKLYNGKLFVTLSELGLGIFDPSTLEQVGKYNLYTDSGFTEDYFGGMVPSESVASDPVTGELYIDEFTGMPDYRQVNFEIMNIMKGDSTSLTPWSDFERYGKFYYFAQDLDVAEENGRTVAYVACTLGGIVAVDVTGYDTATQSAVMDGSFLGFFPAAPTNGMITTGSDPASLLPYEGAGILKEAGFTSVKVNGDNVYGTEHFAGLVIIDRTAPELNWHGSNPSYNNDFDGIPANQDPEYENVTSYDMSSSDPLDHEALPVAFYETPVALTTCELNGHGNNMFVMDVVDLSDSGSIDVLECSGAGGFNFVDIAINDSTVPDGFTVAAYFPTTDEIGAAADGSATQPISLGHTMAVDASSGYLYVSDGPHGVSAWNLFDDSGNQIVPHLVANTLQDEYPEIVDGVTIYPAPHSRNIMFDPINAVAWSLGDGAGLRRVSVDQVEAGIGQIGAPLLMPLEQTDCYEHNADWGNVKKFAYQDHAYDVVIVGKYAYVADGSNGLTVWDISRTLSKAFVGNIGADKLEPTLGTASAIKLWTNTTINNDNKVYAFVACGPKGIGVVDVTDPSGMALVKVFEPIKMEDDKVGAADGQAYDVAVVGDIVYLSYDSFGVVNYYIADLIEPLPDGISPTEVWKKDTEGSLVYDYRPDVIGRFKLQYLPEYADWAGASLKLTPVVTSDETLFYIGYGAAGAVCLDMTNPVAPSLVSVTDTVGECVDIEVVNGVLYCADGAGGIAVLR